MGPFDNKNWRGHNKDALLKAKEAKAKAEQTFPGNADLQAIYLKHLKGMALTKEEMEKVKRHWRRLTKGTLTINGPDKISLHNNNQIDWKQITHTLSPGINIDNLVGINLQKEFGTPSIKYLLSEMKPKFCTTINNKKCYFSNVFSRLSGLYTMYYSQISDNQYIPVPLYKSMSGGEWKIFVPSEKYIDSGFYSKGKHYTKSNKPLEEISSFMNGLESDSNMNNILEMSNLHIIGVLNEICKIYRSISNKTNDINYMYGDRMVESKYNLMSKFISDGHFSTDMITDNYDNPLNFSAPELNVDFFIRMGNNSAIDFIPDFTKGTTRNYETMHPVLGEAKVYVFTKRLQNGEEMEIHFANPVSGGLPYIYNTYIKDNEILFNAVNKKVFDFGILDLKPLEYNKGDHKQIPKFLMESGLIKEVHQYGDLRPFLNQLDILKGFNSWLKK